METSFFQFPHTHLSRVQPIHIDDFLQARNADKYLSYYTHAAYTSRGYGCGKYIELVVVDSKALKQAHSWLRNCLSNADYRQKRPIEIRKCGRAKYN